MQSRSRSLPIEIDLLDDDDFEDSNKKKIAPKASAENEGINTCFVCACSLATLDANTKDSHLNRCLDRLEVTSVHSTSEKYYGLRSENYECIICGLSLSKRSLSSRCQHLKRCSKLYNIGIRELLQMISPDKFEIVLSQMDESKDTSPLCHTVPPPIDVPSITASSPLPSSQYAPLPNAHNVLLANARLKWGGRGEQSQVRANTTTIQQRSMSDTTSLSRSISNTNGGRGRWGGRERIEGSGRGRGRGGGRGSPTPPASPSGYAPDYKKIQTPSMPNPIVVDGFNYASPGLSDCYILTHFHSDHYTGITKDFSAGRYIPYILKFNI
jgi:hypothetical protein